MLRTIFVPLDGSPLAEHALPYADRLADATSACMLLCTIVPLNIIEPPEEDLTLADEARAYLGQTASRLSARGRNVQTITQWGEPAACILDQVQSQQADLIVMSTHGRSGLGRWLYGSVADTVLRSSAVPVMVVPPYVTTAWSSGYPMRIVVPLDGSKLAEAALSYAEELARALSAEILLVEIVPFPPYSLYDNGAAMTAFDLDKEIADSKSYLADVAAGLTSSGIQVRTCAELEHPAVAIASIADREKADLIIMATHGRSGLARLVLGSVATGTLQRTTVPVMLLGPAALHDVAALGLLGSPLP
jgi:nucleotide-binding universal stress UspA family protein